MRRCVDRHPLFDEFTGHPPAPTGELPCDWIGVRWRREWADGTIYFPEGEPKPAEEYLEWIDLLEAVKAAEGSFAMLDLGAGWGRWGLRGALAARQRGIAGIDIRLVEADPRHLEWAREAIGLNRLADAGISLVEAAVCYSPEPVQFAVYGNGQDAANWYGQFLAPPSDAPDGTYCGRPAFLGSNGFHKVDVARVRLEQLTADMAVIDLIDMDIQGAEGELVTHSIDTLSAKVRRVHIETHSTEIEHALRTAFTDAGWICRWDFTLGQRQPTPFGPQYFWDGLQTWLNPRLAL